MDSPQCTFLGLTMKPVPRPKAEDEDSVTELKKHNGAILKVTLLKSARHHLPQNDKAFNASKEEIDFIDNNEEPVKVIIPKVLFYIFFPL